MKGQYYLSEILCPSRFRQGIINLIQAPVGSGKTHFAFEELPKHILGNDYMLFITDTNMNREQILATFANASKYKKSWREFLNTQPKPEIRNGWGTMASKITVMNYAEVAALLHYGHQFDWSQFDYVVCDELHNLVYYDKIKQKDGSTGILHNTIKKINDTLRQNPNVIIVGLTATPTAVSKSFRSVWNVLSQQEIESLRQYQIFNAFYYRDYVKVLQSLPKSDKGILYFDRIRDIKIAENILLERGHRTGSFWSTKNDEHPMEQRQLDVRQHIIDNHRIPQDIDVLLINAAAQTGVNIKNEDFTFMLTHADLGSDTQIQARGRLRNDLDVLYYYKKDCIDIPNPVPTEYLNNVFPASKTNDLCAEIRLMKPKENDYYKWAVTRKYLEQNGYVVTDKKIGKGSKTRGYLIELL